MQKVIAGNTIEEAYRQGHCPHCSKEEPATYGMDSEGPVEDWLPLHLSRCKARKKDIAAGKVLEENKSRWAGHEQYGSCMILGQKHGLVLVENANGRYIASAGSLKADRVSEVVRLIKDKGLSHEEYQQLLAHLAKEAHIEEIEAAPIDNSNVVEFKHANRYIVGQVLKRHGLRRIIIKPADNTLPEMNIGVDEVTRVVE